MSDRVVSWIRTAIPGLWATLISLLTTHFVLPDEVVDWLGAPTTVGVIVWAALAAWYALWRWLEPRLPDFLTRLVLGSAQAPRYDLTATQNKDGVFEVNVNPPSPEFVDAVADALAKRQRRPHPPFDL